MFSGKLRKKSTLDISFVQSSLTSGYSVEYQSEVVRRVEPVLRLPARSAETREPAQEFISTVAMAGGQHNFLTIAPAAVCDHGLLVARPVRTRARPAQEGSQHRPELEVLHKEQVRVELQSCSLKTI